MGRRISLGLDSSTQSLTAVAVDMEQGEVITTKSIDYAGDQRLLRYGIDADEYLVPPRVPGEADQPPKLYLASLQYLFDDLKREGFDFASVAVLNVSGQQHGHLYLNKSAPAILAILKKPGSGTTPLVELTAAMFSYGTAPIWRTSNTALQAEEIRRRAGGKAAIINSTGSDSPLRFTGTVIRRVAQQFPQSWDATATIQLISSFIPALLVGDARVPWDYGNACGTSLMNYRRRLFTDELLEAVGGDLPGGAQGLKSRLPGLTDPTDLVGYVAAWFVERYGFPEQCAVLAGSGDNPQTKVLVAGDLLSLGTSFVFMVSTDGDHVDRKGFANAMYDGVGRPFMFGCRTNGAMLWDRVRAAAGLSKNEYAPAEAALESAKPGEHLFLWQPFDESFPVSPGFDQQRVDYMREGLADDYPGIIDSTLSSVYRYSAGFAPHRTDPLYVSGGATGSHQIMRRIAAIWNRPVITIGSVGAGLGAAVAGALGAARLAGEKFDLEKFSAAVLPRGKAIEPSAEDVAAYHGDEGYLKRFTAEYNY